MNQSQRKLEGKKTFAFASCVCVLIGWLIMDGGIAGFSCLGLGPGLAVSPYFRQ